MQRFKVHELVMFASELAFRFPCKAFPCVLANCFKGGRGGILLNACKKSAEKQQLFSSNE